MNDHTLGRLLELVFFVVEFPLHLQILHRRMHRIKHRMQADYRILGKYGRVLLLVLGVAVLLLPHKLYRILHLMEVVHRMMGSNC